MPGPVRAPLSLAGHAVKAVEQVFWVQLSVLGRFLLNPDLKGAQNTELHPEEPLQPLRSHVSWCPQRSACHRRQLLRATATRTGYLGRAKSGGLSRENPAGEPVQGAGRERAKATAHVDRRLPPCQLAGTAAVSNVAVRSPKASTAPGLTTCGSSGSRRCQALLASSQMNVPLVEPRSITMTSQPLGRSSACTRDMLSF